ncbi:MAG TPA: TetR/AcrR family transcriptional regulator [Candidatus Binataceae bacterium]|nr:TetR/AcrR family transcriptional regulator [Candidatus Binataceae bacterium]
MAALHIVPSDGRAARGHRARAAVAAAMLDLLNDGVVKPTAAQIAERAGVSLRLVFHHFEDLEAILADAADLQYERLRPLLRSVSPSLALERRIAEFVRIRTELHEAVSPVRRASIRLEPFSPVIAQRLGQARSILRNEAELAFGNELGALPSAERRDALAALEAVSAWETWEVMRLQQGLSPTQARKAITHAITGLLRGRSGI